MRSLFVALALGLLTYSASASTQVFMTLGGISSQPVGHYDFCKRYEEQCRPNSTIEASRMTDELWSRVVEINDAVNTVIFPRTDLEIYGVDEFWEYPKSEGDCEDYALLKQYMLEEEGFPRSALLVTVLRQPNGDGHAVLTLRTDRGDYVLDNLEEAVRPWAVTPYTYLKRQSVEHSGVWVDILDTRNLVSEIAR